MTKVEQFEEKAEITGYSDDVGGIVDAANDHLSDFATHCQSRPALPHEKEDFGKVRFLTQKGEQKWDQEKDRLTKVFTEIFGFDPEFSGYLFYY